MTAAPILSPADLAAELGTDARTTRKFLRSITPKEGQPGKGSRWAIKGTKTEVTRLRKAFAAFEKEQEAARAAREAAKAVEAPAATNDDEAIADAPEGDDLDALDSLEGPSDEELLAIDADA